MAEHSGYLIIGQAVCKPCTAVLERYVPYTDTDKVPLYDENLSPDHQQCVICQTRFVTWAMVVQGDVDDDSPISKG